MKKIITLCFLMALVCVKGWGQTNIFEGFESGVVPPTTTPGWTVSGSYSSYLFASNASLATSPTPAPYAGSYDCEWDSYNATSGATELLISPKIDWSARGTNTPTVTLYFYRDGKSTVYTDNMTLLVNTSASTTSATTLGTIYRERSRATTGSYISGTSTTTTTGWYAYTFTIPSTYTSATNYLIFQFTSNDGYDCFLDNITYQTYPTITTDTWTGATSTDWNTATNWSTGSIPSASSPVVIPSTTNKPIISSATAATCATITLASGTSLAINGTLTDGGNFTNNGATSISGTGTLTFSSATTIGGTASTTFASPLTVAVGSSSTTTLASGLTTTINGTLTNAGTVTTTGTLVIGTTGTYTHAENGGTIPTATWSTGSTCNITGITSTAPGGLGQSFYNFTWNCTGQSASISLAGALATVNGNLSVLSTSSANSSTSGYYLGLFSASGTLTIGGNFTMSGSTYPWVVVNYGTGTTTVNITGSLTMSGSTGLLYSNYTNNGTCTYNITGNCSLAGTDFKLNYGLTTTSPILNVSGALTVSAGYLDLNGYSTTAGSTVNITGVGGTTISGTGSISMDDEGTSGTCSLQTTSFTSNGTGNSSTDGAIPNCSVEFGEGSAVNHTQFKISGNFLHSSTNVFYTSSTSQVGSFFFNGTGTASSPQTLSYSGTNSDYTSYVVNTGTYVKLSTGLTIGPSNSTSPASLFTTNGTLDCGTNTLTGGGTGQTFTLASGATLVTANTNGVQSGTVGSISTALTSTFNSAANYTFNGIAAQTANFSNVTMNNLTINNGTGVTLGAATTSPVVNGILSLTSGAFNTGTSTTPYTLTLNGPITTTSGSIVGGGTAAASVSALTVAGSGTVTGTLALSGNFGAFTWSRTTGGTISGSFNVDGNWSNSAAALLNLSTNATTVTFNLAGTQTFTGNTTFYNLAIGSSASGNKDFGATTTTVAGTYSQSTGTMVTSGANTFIFTGAAGSITGTTQKNFVNLQINSGAVITNPSGTSPSLSISGNYTNNGTFTQTVGLTTAFSGTTQSLSGTGTTTFGNVTVQGTSTLGAGSHNINVGGVFSVSSGGTFNGGTATVNFQGTTTSIGSGAGTFNFNNVTIGLSSILTDATNNTSFNVSGNWLDNGTYTKGTETITFNGSSAQTITATGTENFYNFTVNNTSGGVTLGSQLSVSGTATFTKGILATTNSTILNILNTANTAMAGGSTTSYVNGPVRWSLPNLTASALVYKYLVGSGTTYLPFSATSITSTTTPTLAVQAFLGSTGGTGDGTTLATSGSLSTTEYWGTLIAAGTISKISVSLTRQTSVSPYTAIAQNNTLAGAYTSIGGTPSGNSINNSNIFSPTATEYYVLAQSPAITITSTLNPTSVTTCAGTASANMTLSVSGAALASGIIVTPPSGFEVSLSATGPFSSSVTVGTGGTIASTPVYVRLAAGDAAGTYSGNISLTSTGAATVTTAIATSTVNPNATIVLSSAAGTNAQTLCVNTAITNITYTVGGGGTGAGVTGLPSGVTGSFSGTTFTISGTPTVAGTYNYTVTTTGTCAQTTATGTITVNPNATIVLSSAAGTNAQTPCINTAITNITYTVGGGGTGAGVTGLPSGVTGSFSGTTFTISGTPTIAGTYNYTVTTTGTCAQTTATGTITVNPNATIVLSSAAGTNAQTLCVNTAITNITYTVSGGGTGAGVTGLPTGVTGSFSGTTFTISGTPTVAGTYNYTVTTTGTCAQTTATGTITVNAATSITSQPSTTNQNLCEGSGTYALSVTATGTGTPTYQWYYNASNSNSGGTPISGANSSTYTIDNTVPSSYYYYVTVTGGCGMVTSNVSGLITVSATQISGQPVGATYCQNATATALSVTASGTGIDYQWYSNTTNNNTTGVMITNATSKNYTPSTAIVGTTYYYVMVMGSCGTVTSSTAQIIINQASVTPTSATASATTICNGQSTTLTLNGGAGTNTVIHWYTGSCGGTSVGTGNGLSVSPTTTTTYYGRYEDNTPCSTVTSCATVTITVNPTSVAGTISGAGSVCSGINSTTLTLSGYTGTIQWQSSANNTTFANIGGATSATYTATNLTATTYYRAVVTSGTCSSSTTSSVTVTVNPVPSIANKITTAACNGLFSVTPTNGTDVVPSGTTYSWSAPIGTGFTGGAVGTNQSSISGTLTNTTNAAVTATYTVTPTSGTCTSSSFTVTVTVNPVPTIGDKTTSTCSGNSFTVTPTNGTDIVPSGTTYSWSIPTMSAGVSGGTAASGQTSISGTLTNSGSTAGTATYTVTPTSGTCSGSTFTVTVTVNPNVTAGTISGTTPLCIGTTATYTSNGTTGGTWSSSATGIATVNASSGLVTAVAAGTANITYTVSSGCGSPVSTSKTLTVNSLPTVTVSPTSATYCSTPVTLTAGGASTYSWSPATYLNTTSGASVTASNVTATTTYTVTGTDANGCVNTATSVITAGAVPSAVTVAPPTATICPGSTQLLTASGGVPTRTILTQNFNDVTNNWTATNSSTGGTPSAAAWTLQPDGYSYSGTTGKTFTFHSNDNSQFYLSNSDAQGGPTSNITNTTLQSPAFSTVNYTSATIGFYQFLEEESASSTATVEASTDGSSWTILQTYVDLQGGAGSWANSSVILTSAFLNQSTVYIRFHYVASWRFFWGIDNVTVSGNQAAAPITWSSPTNTDLFTDAGGTIHYTAGTASTTVYAKPVTSPVTYTATATSASGCSASGTSVISVNPAPTASFGSPGPFSTCYGTGYNIPISGTANSTVTYQVDGNGAFTASTGSSGNSFITTSSSLGSSTTTTSHSFTLVSVSNNTTGCTSTISGTANVTVTALPTITLSSGNGSPSVCKNNAIPTITFTLGGTATGATVTGLPNGVTATVSGTTVTINGTPTATGTYTVTSTGNGSCSAATYQGTISINPFITWTGAQNANWNNANNWCSNSIPSATDNVVIASGTPNNPVLPTDITVNNLAIDAGATVNNNGHTLTAGTVSGSGTITGSSTSSLITNATSTVNFTTGANILKNLTVNGGTLTLGSDLDITGGSNFGIVTVANAAVLNTGGHKFTLKSDVNGTAAVAANMSGSTYITGHVTAERYTDGAMAAAPGIPRRAWRLITSPVTGVSINGGWQEGQVYNSQTGTNYLTGTMMTATKSNTYGTLITSNITVGTAANNVGYDYTGGVTSIKQYTPGSPSGSWVPLTDNQNSSGLTGTLQDIHIQPAYMLFVRGNRTIGTTGTTVTTLRSTGTLNQGSQPVGAIHNAGSNVREVAGNPYASAIDFEQVYSQNTNLIQNKFAVWKSGLGTYGAYAYVAPDGNGGYAVTPNSLSASGGGTTVAGAQFIQSGEGFLVYPQSGAPTGSIMVNEAVKAPTQQATTLTTTFRLVSTDRKLYVNLNLKDSDTTSRLADGFLARFNAAYDTAVNEDDGTKQANFNENLGIAHSSTDLIVEARPDVQQADTIHMKLWNVTQRAYQLQVKGDNWSSAPGVHAYLVDNYLATKQEVSLTGSVSTVNFTVNSDSASWQSDRFRIVFRNDATVLPLTLTGVKAAAQNSGVNVSWTVTNEQNIKTYTVERSTNGGTTFTAIGSQAARNATGAAMTNYQSFDAAPQIGSNLYRIRIETQQGAVSYSEVVTVVIGQDNGRTLITLYPNPVRTNGKVSLSLSNLAAGSYLVSVYSQGGQTVYEKKITIGQSNTSQSEELKLSSTLAQGSYEVRLTNTKAVTIFSDKLVVGR